MSRCGYKNVQCGESSKKLRIRLFWTGPTKKVYLTTKALPKVLAETEWIFGVTKNFFKQFNLARFIKNLKKLILTQIR